MPQRVFIHVVASFLLVGLVGCGKSSVDKALESDANGYLCTLCKTKFYTDREVFAGFCPQCKRPNIEQVIGMLCPADQHVTITMRGRGAVPCEQCQKPVQGMCMPGEKDFKAWGATKKTAAEVGG